MRLFTGCLILKTKQLKKYILLIVFIISCHFINAQENYSELIEKAKTFESDSTKQKQALNTYLKAFKTYPDSISESDQYWFTVLAAELKENDLAFKYLTPLAKLEKDKEGFPGWDLILGDYAEEDYHNLFSDDRWKKLKKQAIPKRKIFFKKLSEKQNEFYQSKQSNFRKVKNSKKLFKLMSEHNPYLPKARRNYSISFVINDSTKTSYLVHLPKDYTPKKSYPLLFFLHGAVHGNTLQKFLTPEIQLNYWNRFYTKYADKENVILVFPSGGKNYNWMTPDEGFFMVPEMLKQIKSAINVDDNKVFISGHSNGATGSFSYLMKQPTAFAGFYGFNTYPMVVTGGTFVENILNRSFINFSTNQDYYYPPNANDRLDSLMQNLKADYKDYRYNGFPHWFPQFDESEDAFKTLFEDLKKRERNPFPNTITWEFDDNSYGNIDWIRDVKLDTLSPKKDWQKQINFSIDKWLKYDKNDSLITVDVNKKAFDFPRKSGKIKAEYSNNVFTIKTSRIKSFKIEISPEMIDTKKKVKVYLNGKLYFNKEIEYDRDYMIKNFKKHNDRKQSWINYIKLDV